MIIEQLQIKLFFEYANGFIYNNPILFGNFSLLYTWSTRAKVVLIVSYSVIEYLCGGNNLLSSFHWDFIK